jgi:hypothetical protein
MAEETQAMFKVLVVVLLAGSLLALGWMVLEGEEAAPHSKVYLKPESLEKQGRETGFEWSVENYEGKSVAYTAMYYANGFYLGREDFVLENGEKRESSQSFDLDNLGLKTPIKISLQVYSQEKSYNLFYWV